MLSGGHADSRARHPVPRGPWVVGALIVACILGGGLFYLEQLQLDVRRHAADHLEAVSRLKVRLVENWREERLSDAFSIGAHPLVARTVSRARGGSEAAREDLREWCRSWLMRREYRTAAVFDPHGALLAWAGPQPDAVPVRDVLAAGRAVLSDLHKDAAGIVHADLLVPLSDPDDRLPVGLALLRALPADRLFPLMERWPTPSRTGQILLVRRDGEDAEVLFAARLSAALHLPVAFPSTRAELPAVRAANGEFGLLEGADPAAHKVLAYARPVPGTTWALVAHLDEEEIDGPMRERRGWVLLLCAALSAVAVTGAFLWWRAQLGAFRRRQREAELERMAVERHFSYLRQHTNDILLLADGGLRIVDANDRAVAAYGYDREELLGRSLRDVLAPRARAALESWLHSASAGKDDVYETLHQRSDGTQFPVQTSCRILEIEGERYYQSVIRDITERKSADHALRRTEERLRLALEESGLGLWDWDVRRGELYLCPTLARRVGAAGEEAGAGDRDALRRLFHPDDVATTSEGWRRLLDGTEDRFVAEMRLRTGAGEWSRVLQRARVVERDGAQRAIRVIGTVADVAAKE